MIEQILVEWMEADNQVYDIKQRIKELETQLVLAETQSSDCMIKAKDYMNSEGILEDTINGEKLDYKLSFTKPRGSVKCPDSDAVPDEFCKIERKPKLKEIKEYLDAGNESNWASIEYTEPKVTYKVMVRK